MADAFYSSADDEARFSIRRLLICASQIGISGRRWGVFGMFEISYAQRNRKIQGGEGLAADVSVGVSRCPTHSMHRPMMKRSSPSDVC